MMSRHLMKIAAQELGFQITINQSSFVTERLLNFKNNLMRELGSSQCEDPDFFEFANVHYLNERPMLLFLRFISPETFEVLDDKKEVLCEARLNQEISLKNLGFVVNRTPKNVSLQKNYKITVAPMFEVINNLQKKFQIKMSKLDKNILHLSFVHSNRHVAAKFLNHMMSSYQRFLKEENEQLTQAQLVYLELRQEELSLKMEKTLEEHAAYLKKNLGDNGFIGLSQEIEILAIPKEEYTSRLFDIDLELKRIQSSKSSRSFIAAERYKMDQKIAMRKRGGPFIRL